MGGKQKQEATDDGSDETREEQNECKCPVISPARRCTKGVRARTKHPQHTTDRPGTGRNTHWTIFEIALGELGGGGDAGAIRPTVRTIALYGSRSPGSRSASSSSNAQYSTGVWMVQS